MVFADLRYDRLCRTSESEAYLLSEGDTPVGRVDLHYGRFEVSGTIMLEVDLTEDEVHQLIDQVDEELVQSYDPEREDFLVTVYKGEELGFYSDEYEEGEEEEN